MKRAPFDPGDPFQVMCETFRRQVVDMAIDAEKITIYRDLGSRQCEAFIAGTLTGLIGVALATYGEAAHDTVMDAIRGYLGEARFMTENMRGAPLSDAHRPEGGQ